MEDLSFIEIKFKEKERKQEDPFYVSNNMHSNFIISSTYGSGITDVSDVVAEGNYHFSSEYTIIFLYDYMNDQESRDFISCYGGELHNRSSANITILTYFSTDTLKNWTNVHYRNRIRASESTDPMRIMTMMNRLKNMFGVESYPAAVIIKNNEDEIEESCNISLKGQNKKALYMSFLQMMSIISHNCEEDFEVIASKIEGRDYKRNNNINDDFNTANFIYDLVKNDPGYTQERLAWEMGIDVRTLRNKRNNNSFKRTECFKLALILKMKIEDLNKLLRHNGHLELGFDGFDLDIRMALNNGEDVTVVDRKLKKKYNTGLYEE